jgi:hypothetical protein
VCSVSLFLACAFFMGPPGARETCEPRVAADQITGSPPAGCFVDVQSGSPLQVPDPPWTWPRSCIVRCFICRIVSVCSVSFRSDRVLFMEYLRWRVNRVVEARISRDHRGSELPWTH